MELPHGLTIPEGTDRIVDMNRGQRNNQVTEELKHIPGESSDQNMLRASYHNTRRHDLGRNPALSSKDALRKAIESVRQHNPDFQPDFDKDFFQT